MIRYKTIKISKCTTKGRFPENRGGKLLLIILPFLGHLSFEIRNKLNSYIRNQLPSYSLRIAFQSKTRLSSLFKFKGTIPKYLC